MDATVVGIHGGNGVAQLTQEQAGQLLLGQLGDGGGGDLAEVLLAAVVGIHGGNGVENELFSNVDFVLDRTLSTTGKGSKDSSDLDGAKEATNTGQGGCAGSQASDSRKSKEVTTATCGQSKGWEVSQVKGTRHERNSNNSQTGSGDDSTVGSHFVKI